MPVAPDPITIARIALRVKRRLLVVGGINL
jgi:hypothetical protein